MPNKTPPASQSADPSAESDAAAVRQVNVEKADALDEVIREATEAKNTDWRPRQRATVARRLGRFEDELKRNSVKPPPR